MDTTAELCGGTEAYHAYLVAIFLTEEGNGTELLGFFDGCVTVFVEWKVGANHLVDDVLHLAQLLIADFLEVVEVKAKRLVVDIRTALLGLVAQYLLERIVEQVGCRMVAG